MNLFGVSGDPRLSYEELVRLLGERDRQVAELTATVAELTDAAAESAAAMAGLTAANEEMAAKLARLVHLLSRNSGNSSRPPSKDDDDPGRTPVKAKDAKGSGGPKRSRGKQPGAPGSHLAWRDEPDDVIDRFPEGDCECGSALADAVDLGVVDRYQQHDIPLVTVTVVQYDQHEVECACGRVHAARRPAGARVSAPVAYGPNLQAFAVYLMVVHHLPVQRCAQLLESLTGAAPSVGFVHSMIAHAGGLLTAVTARIRALIALAYAVCLDETPIRVGPKTPRPGRKKADKYLIVACTELYTHYLLGDRDLDTFELTVLADLAGTDSVIVHDRYQNYDSTELGEFIHQLCCAHLLRDTEAAVQTYPDADWAPQIRDALRELIHQANLARDKGLARIAPDIADPLIKTFHDGVTVGLSETTRHGKRPGERKTRLLLEALRDRAADVLRFTTDLRIPPTSNRAERDLRPAKIQQNTSGRLTSVDRTQDRYTIRGYVSTATKHGHNAIDTIRDALTGHPWWPPDPVPA